MPPGHAEIVQNRRPGTRLTTALNLEVNPTTAETILFAATWARRAASEAFSGPAMKGFGLFKGIEGHVLPFHSRLLCRPAHPSSRPDGIRPECSLAFTTFCKHVCKTRDRHMDTWVPAGTFRRQLFKVFMQNGACLSMNRGKRATT